MKRGLLFLCLLVIMLIPCSCIKAEADQPYLEQDEYGAYQDDEFVTSCVELGRFGKRNEFTWFSLLYDIPIEKLNTKRGIHIGSTLDDIATAYDGIHFSCPRQKLYDEPIETLAQELDTKEYFEITTWSYFKRHEFMKGKGTPISDEKEIDKLKFSGDGIETHLTFKVEDGIVTDIILFCKVY